MRSSPKFANVKQKLTPLQLKVELPIGSTITKDMDFDFEFSTSFDPSDLIFDLDQVDSPPEAILKIPPVYPLSARRLGKEGQVELLFVVNAQGDVENVMVVDSEPRDVFDEAAVKTIKKWKFKPARKNNKPVSCRVEIPLTFRLKR
jgi:protein TonB